MNQDERNALCEVVAKLTALIAKTRDLDKVYEYVTQLNEIRTKIAAAEAARPSAIKSATAKDLTASAPSRFMGMAAAVGGDPDSSPEKRTNPARK